MKAFRSAAIALCLAPVLAQAQSSVTLFGVMDVGVRYAKNGTNDMWQVASGGHTVSRLGFRGVEDLGGGMKAGFWIESQVNADTGTTAAKFWHRRATLSLMGSWGEVRLGRDFSPAYRVAIAADPFADTGLGSLTAMFSGTSINGATYNTHVRLDNAVSYFLPESPAGGLYGTITVAPGEGTPGNKLYGGLLGYRKGPVMVSAGYSETEITTSNVKNAAVAGSYDFGPIKLMSAWSQLRYTTARENHVNVSATVPVGPTGVIRMSAIRSVGSGGLFTADGRKNIGNKFAVGYVYDLSKRTSIYADVAYVKNKGGAAFVVSSGPAMNGTTSRGADFGIKHSF